MIAVVDGRAVLGRLRDGGLARRIVPAFETIFIFLLAIAAGLTTLLLFVALKRSRASPAGDALGAGQFEDALVLAGRGLGDQRDEWMAGAVAAKHLARWSQAHAFLDRILAEDPKDGEGLAERGLLSLYQDRPQDARGYFQSALAQRGDLIESLTLHLALTALVEGNLALARRTFEEVEVSLETKLRIDLGDDEPLFSEWLFHAAALWDALGKEGKARWAWGQALAAAPASQLSTVLNDLGLAQHLRPPGPEPCPSSTT